MTMNRLLQVLIYAVPFLLIPYHNMREMHLLIASTGCLAIFWLAVKKGFPIEEDLKWLPAFILFIIVGHYLSPKVSIPTVSDPSVNPWAFKCLYYIICFYLGFIGLRATKIVGLVSRTVIMSMTTVGTIMSVIVWLQLIGFNQFMVHKEITQDVLRGTRMPWLLGTFDHSSLVGSFIAICALVSINTRRRWELALMIATICLIQSSTSIAALVIGGVAYFLAKKGKALAFAITSLVMTLVAFSVILTYALSPDNKMVRSLGDNGRFTTWVQTVETMARPVKFADNRTFSWTGFGIGNYPVMYGVVNKSNFHQAHNEYLELLFNVGVIGFVLFLLALSEFFIKNGFLQFNEVNAPYIAAFVSSCVSAFGTFAWQIGPIAFYTILTMAVMWSVSEHQRSQNAKPYSKQSAVPEGTGIPSPSGGKVEPTCEDNTGFVRDSGHSGGPQGEERGTSRPDDKSGGDAGPGKEVPGTP